MPPSLVSNTSKRAELRVLDYLILYLRIVGNYLPVNTRQISEDSNLQHHRWRNLNSRIFLILILFIRRKTVEKRPFSLLLVSLSRSKSYERSVASSTAISPQSAIYCFLFQFQVSSRFLNIIQQLLKSSTSCRQLCSPPIFPSVTCFSTQLFRQMGPNQLASPFLFYIGYSCHP